MESKTDKLRADLKRLLDQKNPDYSQILALTAELANHDDPEHVRFTASSGIISRLGEELVARQETAVSELVKNAYDADAQEVTLTFVGAEKPGGELIIIDDGLGMSRAQLVDGFMRLASIAKITQPISPRFKRQRAGRKGIGRFAAQRLGTALELTTQTEDSDSALRLTIDWTHFQDNRDLFSIPSRIGSIKKEQDQGTTLRIRGLRDTWTDAEIARVYRHVGDLIQPFPLSKRRKINQRSSRQPDPGFKARFYRRVAGKRVEVASEERMVFDFAHAEVTASVDASGRGKWQLRSERFVLDESSALGPSKDVPSEPYAFLRDVTVRAYYFIWDPALIPAQQYGRLRSLAGEQGGIRVYRNGFRVLPYGERRDDWLGLDEETRKRSILPPIAKINWFGFVELTDSEGAQFEETSSREGLANSPAYHELVDFVRNALFAAALRVASARETKLTAGQKGFISKRPRSSGDVLDDAAKELEKAADELQASTGLFGGKRAADEVDKVRFIAAGVRKAKEELVEENAMLRVLSSLGLTIGIFTHEVRHQLFHLRNLVQDWLERHASTKVAKAILPELNARIGLLQSYAGYFDNAISANVRRELEPQNLSHVLFAFIEQFRQVAERCNCRFFQEIDEDLTTIPMHPSEWASILGNLFTNSIKAIRNSSNRGDGRILIKARKIGPQIVIDFADNGHGVPPESRDRIFEPFFTTTNAVAENDDELTGTGLGLKIVRDIVTAYNGDIFVTNPPQGYVTSFRMEIPTLSQP